MIRLLHIPELHQVLLHPVPECHRRSKYSSRFKLFSDIKTAEDAARMLLTYQSEREKRLYSIGYNQPDPHFKHAENWRPKSDAVVGRRILNRSSNKGMRGEE